MGSARDLNAAAGGPNRKTKRVESGAARRTFGSSVGPGFSRRRLSTAKCPCHASRVWPRPPLLSSQGRGNPERNKPLNCRARSREQITHLGPFVPLEASGFQYLLNMFCLAQFFPLTILLEGAWCSEEEEEGWGKEIGIASWRKCPHQPSQSTLRPYRKHTYRNKKKTTLYCYHWSTCAPHPPLL